MDSTEFVQSTVAAVVAHFTQRGIEVTVEKAREIIKGIVENAPPGLRRQIDVESMALKIQETAGAVGQTTYDEETLARFLEMPVADLGGLLPDTVDTRLLYSHIKLEHLFSEWLEEWGYEVECGKSLMGLKNIEYVPDVYGVLDTLHGQFEICISFICDDPPDEDRVLALLHRIEAYAEAKESFSYNDIFALATPYRFGSGAENNIALQNEQEKYVVIGLEGSDVHTLENQDTPKDRLSELHQKVQLAVDLSKSAKAR